MALVNYVGVIYAATGMNAEGLFVELNAGPWVGFSLQRRSIFTSLFTFLQDCSNLDELTLAMLATLPELNTIINAADRRSACSFESSLWHARRRGPNEPGFIAATNHFLSLDWPPANYDPQLRPDTTFRRYENLLRLGQRYYGRFSPAVMMRVLDTTIENGGPTEVAETIFQVVAIPAHLVLWVKMPGTQDWTEVPLGPLMGGE